MFNIFLKLQANSEVENLNCSKSEIAIESETLVTYESDSLKESVENWLELEFHQVSILSVLKDLDIKLPALLIMHSMPDCNDGYLLHCIDADNVLYDILLGYSSISKHILSSNITYSYNYCLVRRDSKYFKLSSVKYSMDNAVISMSQDYPCLHNFHIKLKDSDGIITSYAHFDSNKNPSAISLSIIRSKVLQILMTYDYSNFDSFSLYSILSNFYSSCNLQLVRYKFLSESPSKKIDFRCEYNHHDVTEYVYFHEYNHKEYSINSLGDWYYNFHDVSSPITRISHDFGEDYNIHVNSNYNGLDDAVSLKNMLDSTINQISEIQSKLGWNNSSIDIDN